MVQIRNFSIIAHIDHGKSTLADRFIQRAKLVEDRQFHDQMLDNMDIERERGITIKSQTVCLPYTNKAGEEFIGLPESEQIGRATYSPWGLMAGRHSESSTSAAVARDASGPSAACTLRSPIPI